MEGYAEVDAGPGQRLRQRRHDGNGLPRVRRAAPRPRPGRQLQWAALVIVRSSNSEGCSVQNARLADGRTVADALAGEITAFNTALGHEIGPVGAVVGATVNGIAANVLSRLSRSLILAPGVGAQGASLDDVRNNFGSVMGRTLPSVSRSILRHGPSPAALRGAIDRYRVEAWRAAESQHRCNFGRVAKPHAGLRRMPFAFPVKPDVKHRPALLRIGTDHRAGRPRWTLP
jgi:Orotidine 5'-phosphate decarboxylase / HUMPS family